MVKKALLFGLEYLGQPGELIGCKRDAEDFATYLKEHKHYDNIRICTSDAETGAQFMIYKIYKMAIDTWRTPIQEVCIYYSGHGANMPDYNRDEHDGKDECLIPTDYQRAGVISDDLLRRVFKYFHPNTRVVFVCDACHSGSMCDLKYKWNGAASIEQHQMSKCNARIVSISGCKDDQVSWVGYDLRGEGKRRSVLTALLLKTLEDGANTIKETHSTLLKHVQATKYKQDPEVMTSFTVFSADTLFL